MKKEVEARAKSYNAVTGNAQERYADRLKQGRKQWKNNWKMDGNASSARHLKALMHVVNAADIAEKDWWLVFKIPASRVQPTGASSVRHEVLRAFRNWSRNFTQTASKIQGSAFHSNTAQASDFLS